IVTDGLRHLWEKLEISRGLGFPGLHLLLVGRVVECTVQLDAVELRSVIGQLVFGPPRIESFEVLPVPFCTAHVHRQWLICLMLFQQRQGIRVGGWQGKIYRFWIFNASEFHMSRFEDLKMSRRINTSISV